MADIKSFIIFYPYFIIGLLNTSIQFLIILIGFFLNFYILKSEQLINILKIIVFLYPP